MHRFYVSDISEAEKSIIISGGDVNHIANVLRLSVGDEITVSDGTSRDYLCRITEIDTKDKHEVTADIVDVFDSNAELPVLVYLFQGVPKGDKLETVIQKNIELGCHEVIPVMMERTVVKLDDKKKKHKQARYQGIAESAAKQSGRGIIPEIREYMTFDEAVRYAAGMDYILVPYESAEGMIYTRKLLNDIASSDYNGKKIAVFIGPEGGFSLTEIKKLEEKNAKIFTLGHRILRTETAGMTVMSILSYLFEND